MAGIKTPVVGNSRVNAGKVYARKGVLGTGWLGALGGTFLRGGTLFETLMFNLVLFDGERSGQGCLLQAPHDLPSWERPLPENPADDADPFSEDNFRVGPASLMTWQSRRVRLVPDEAGERVVGLICCYGDFPQVADLQYAETMTAWRLSPAQQKKLGCNHVPWMPALHDAARALWRGLAPLLSASKTADGEVDLRPGVVRWVERLLEAGAPLPERVGICAQSMSYGTQSAVYTDAYDDTVEVPVSALVRGSQAASIALGTVAMAEEGVSALSFLAKTLHEASGDRSAGARLSAALSDVQTEAYGELDGLFRDRLARLPESDPDGGFREGWAADVRAALLEIGERLVVDSAAPLFKVRQKVVGGKSVDVAAGRSFSYYVHKVDEAFGAASAGEGE